MKHAIYCQLQCKRAQHQNGEGDEGDCDEYKERGGGGVWEQGTVAVKMKRTRRIKR